MGAGGQGVAVHPKDERYKSFHGKMLVHPFTDRKIPVILDDVLVDMELGTGAVKVCALFFFFSSPLPRFVRPNTDVCGIL